jgi:cytochrome c oxidase subunit 2
MRVHQYEKAFLWLGAVMLGAFLIALLVIHLPGRAGEVDPLTINRVEPFDNPGVREVGPGRYEVVLLASAWSWNPAEIRVPAGSEVTFLAAATDVIHGLHISGTRVNMMLIPGQISRNTYRFEQPGEHLLICHEYCGAGHHLMSGKVIVE